jgi:hypothetical protein
MIKEGPNSCSSANIAILSAANVYIVLEKAICHVSAEGYNYVLLLTTCPTHHLAPAHPPPGALHHARQLFHASYSVLFLSKISVLHAYKTAILKSMHDIMHGPSV